MAGIPKEVVDVIKRTYPKGNVFHKLVTSAGTPERLSKQNVPCAQVKIKALIANTGIIEYGFDGNKTLIGRGEELESKDHAVIPIDNLNKIWIDSTVNGEGVSVTLVG